MGHCPSRLPDPALATLSHRPACDTTLRTRAEITRFFDGMEMLDPGLVQVHRWRPGSAAPDDSGPIPGYAGLARKPG